MSLSCLNSIPTKMGWILSVVGNQGTEGVLEEERFRWLRGNLVRLVPRLFPKRVDLVCIPFFLLWWNLFHRYFRKLKLQQVFKSLIKKPFYLCLFALQLCFVLFSGFCLFFVCLCVCIFLLTHYYSAPIMLLRGIFVKRIQPVSVSVQAQLKPNFLQAPLSDEASNSVQFTSDNKCVIIH